MIFKVVLQWNIHFSDYVVVLTVFKYKRLSSGISNRFAVYFVSNRLVHSTTFRTNGLIDDMHPDALFAFILKISLFPSRCHFVQSIDCLLASTVFILIIQTNWPDLLSCQPRVTVT